MYLFRNTQPVLVFFCRGAVDFNCLFINYLLSKTNIVRNVMFAVADNLCPFENYSGLNLSVTVRFTMRTDQLTMCCNAESEGEVLAM